MLWGEKPYHSLDYELKSTYGEKLYKIALDAGMTCPNRDGTLGVGGCIFCSAGGSGDFAAGGGDIQAQLSAGIAALHGKQSGNRFIAYFQAFTNTYAPVERLDRLYRSALTQEQVAGISVATRPDCLGGEVLALLGTLRRDFPDKFIWIELGLQTIHESTAALIRRGYPLPVFTDAVHRLHAAALPVVVHVILGLPYETKEMMLETCRFLNGLHIEGVKLQLLHVLRHTDLAVLYQENAFSPLSFENYIDIVISCLEALSPDIVIHRLTGDGPRALLLAPLWSTDKRRVLNTLHQEMKKRGTFQSAAFREN
ncbi:MAG: TIGR01212 family radical SAM protein [Roseburia sp.]|nr:TIGR01212 family radical SAM protein [Roseburia sp.]